MEQAQHFLDECETLAEIISAKGGGRWDEATRFKGWTINNVLVHLHFWNHVADLSLTDESAFDALVSRALKGIETGNLRAFENGFVEERGEALFVLWMDTFRDIARRWATVDPKKRLKWVGPTMSARSSMTARQMETWAHGHEIFDLFGATRTESDRIKNIVILGVNTFAFSYSIRKKPAPDALPTLHLTSPSGEMWTFGNGDDQIRGTAVEFAQVVTQTRNIADTELEVTGDVARDWMENAQCFAGPPEQPPAPGTRFAQPPLELRSQPGDHKAR